MTKKEFYQRVLIYARFYYNEHSGEEFVTQRSFCLTVMQKLEKLLKKAK